MIRIGHTSDGKRCFWAWLGGFFFERTCIGGLDVRCIVEFGLHWLSAGNDVGRSMVIPQLAFEFIYRV